jgi:hypothetical protein
MAESGNSYSRDVEFLRERTDIVELDGEGGAGVAVAPAYQGRVMTSSLGGAPGHGFGWLNGKFIAAGQDDPAFNNYGGEDRFWLGPEAGQYALWFQPGESFDLAHWKTPRGFNSGAFAVIGKTDRAVAMSTRFSVTNYAGFTFDCGVQRTVSMLDAEAAAGMLGAEVPAGVEMVGFESRNVLTNTGRSPWTRQGGLLSVWVLGQFKPLPRGKVIVPFRAGGEAELGVRATTDYFGQLPPDRCRVGEDLLLFSCDGRYRSKIGISPRRSKGVIGSYDPDAEVLTVVQFTQPRDAGKRPYVNSLWKIQDDPFGGDAINSYNDGEPEPGAGQLGPFYEIETSSPAAELGPGASLTHAHRTFHFAGGVKALAAIAASVLGADLKQIG